MATKLIRLADGILVEVEVPEDQAQPISGGIAEKVSSSFDKVLPVLKDICRPIVGAWEELNKDVTVEEAQIELGLSFEGEGNVFVTRSTVGANIIVRLLLKSKD